MRKVLLVHISPVAVATMLNNGDFGFPYCVTPAFSTPAVWCRVFQSGVFHPCICATRAFSSPAFSAPPRHRQDIASVDYVSNGN